MSYPLSMDLLLLSLGQRESYSIALVILSSTLQSFDTSFSRLEALEQVSSIFSSLDDTTTSGLDIFFTARCVALRERKVGMDRSRLY